MSVRGEVKTTVAGREVTLRLTLGAAMEIEESLKLACINEVIPMLQNPSSKTLSVVAHALAKGGGTPLDANELQSLGLNAAVTLVAQAMTAGFSDDDPEAGAGDPEKKA